MLSEIFKSPNVRSAALIGFTVLLIIRFESNGVGQETDFQKRYDEVKERFEKRRNQPKNKLVHDPPMVLARDSALGADEPVIGVYLNGEARGYPLAMLFGGGAVFELLNDTCGDVPISVSW